MESSKNITMCQKWRQLVVVELEVDDFELLQLWKKIISTKWIFGHSLHEGLYQASARQGNSVPSKESTVVAVCKLHKNYCWWCIVVRYYLPGHK